MEKEMLAKIAKQVLSQDTLDALTGWYRKLLDSDAKYVVFMNPHCYQLALMLECLTGKRMTNTGTRKYLTDASALAQIDSVYREHLASGSKAPVMLLVDDVLVHGRNINDFLKASENCICVSDSANNTHSDTEQEKIRQELLHMIGIYVFYCADKPWLLNETYWPLLYKPTRVPEKEWRRLLNGLDIMFTQNAVTNPMYICSGKISEETFEHIRASLPDYVETVYKANTEYTKTAYIKGRGNKIIGIAAVRLIRNRIDRSARVVPFLFLPWMGKEETDGLVTGILDAGYKDTALKDLLAKPDAIPGRRMSNELLTMILSNILLNGFEKRIRETFPAIGDIFDTEDREAEYARLARHYNTGTYKETYEKLKTVLADTSVTYGELEATIISRVKNEGVDRIDPTDGSESELPDTLRATVMRNIEDKVYNSAVNDEQEAQWIARFPYYDTQYHFRRCTACFAAFTTLFRHKEATPPYATAALDYSVRVFLQIIDHGMIELSSHPAAGKQIPGFAQFMRPTGQAMTLMPVRCLMYLPLLSRMELVAKAKQIPLREEAERYFAIVPFENERCRETDVLDLADACSKTGQSVSDWNDNSLRNIRFLRPETAEEDTADFCLKQHELVMEYVTNYRK